MSKIVRSKLSQLPPLTEGQLEELRVLAARPDSETDTSDIPELSKERWTHAVRGGFYRPVKEQLTTRVDSDVVAWLKSHGKGYQSRLNEILRREMLSSLKSATAKQS
jgi:uncharacterized protein (DUF4415 family)